MPCLPVPYHTVPSHPVSCVCVRMQYVASRVPRWPPPPPPPRVLVGLCSHPVAPHPPARPRTAFASLVVLLLSSGTQRRRMSSDVVLGGFFCPVCVCDVCCVVVARRARRRTPGRFVPWSGSGSGRAGAATGTAPHLMLHRSGGCPQRARHQGEGAARQGRLPQKAKHVCGSTASSLKNVVTVSPAMEPVKTRQVTAGVDGDEAKEASRVIDHDVSC